MSKPGFTLRTGIYDAIAPEKFHGQLRGKVAIVTGSSRGIGREVALALAKSGASVAVTGRSDTEVKEAASIIINEIGSTQGSNKVVAVVGDVCSEQDTDQLLKTVESTLGPVDILICNAGVNTFMPFHMTDPSEWWKQMEVNVKGPTELTRKILPAMKARNTGTIIFVSSRAAAADLPWAAAYSCSKTAITRFAGVLQRELDILQSFENEKNGISVFSLHPGEVKTQLHQTAFPEKTKKEAPYVIEHMEKMAKMHPDFKAETPAWTCVYLAAGHGQALEGRLVDSTRDIEEVKAFVLSGYYLRVKHARASEKPINLGRAPGVPAWQLDVHFMVAESEDESQSPYELGWRTILAVLALAMGNVCAALANTTNTTIKFQVATLARSPADASLASWIANGNFLCSLALGPIFLTPDEGSLGDRVGSCVSGSSHNLRDIVGGNVLTGIANAGCEIIPNKLRPWALGVSQAMASAFVVLGTFMAAAVVRYNTGGHGGWRWAYYFNGIIYGFTAFAVSLTYFPPPPRLSRNKRIFPDILTKVDYTGILIMTGAFTSLVIGVTWGGSTYPWDDGRIIATLVVGCVGLLGFGLFERFVVKEGILDHRLFKTRNFPILLVVCTIDGMLLLGVNVLFSQEIFDLFTQDAVEVAIILSPFLVISTFGCIPAGWAMAHTKSYRLLLVLALFWCSLFAGLMGLTDSSRLSWAYGFSSMLGLGTAVTTTIPIVALGLSVPSYLLGTAATISVSCRALGGIIGITIFTAVYNNKYASYVGPELVSTPVDASRLAQSADAWKYVWVVVACIVAANGIAACGLESVKPMMNGHVESALENKALSVAVESDSDRANSR
ncbi:siderophore iron transporter [Seiridium cupressi]